MLVRLGLQFREKEGYFWLMTWVLVKQFRAFALLRTTDSSGPC